MTDAGAVLRGHAAAHGFDVVRFTDVGPAPHAEALDRWLDAGHHGTMDWMPRTADVRRDPRRRMPEARTAMCLAVPHHHQVPPDPGGRTGRVARYAWGRDYHNVVGKRLRKLVRDLRADGIRAWGSVDTGPILERSWATAAGLGFSGKNTVQILPATTSWLFLAVVFVDVSVAPDRPLRDHCGSCRRCLDACPTDAFPEAHRLDARRCISYWTIEAPGIAPRALRPGFGRWVFGCDVCQEVCPHNAAPPEPDADPFAPRHAWLDLDALVATPDQDLLDRFLGTPLRRPGAAGLKRNALIALGNLGDDGAVPVVRAALAHASPVVRAAAVWCLARLGHAPDHIDDAPVVVDELSAVAAGEVGTDR